MSKPAAVALLVVASAEALFGQRPVITPEGLVNAASLSTDPGRGAVVVPGRLLTLFGQALAETAEAAQQAPLPTTLAGVTVTVDGIPAPLLYVSPGQINFQVPFAISAPSVPVVVTTAKGASEPIVARLVFDAPGIFTREGAGCGHGAILNVALDGSTSINDPSQSASPGGFISVFATGFGLVFGQPPDGWAAASDNLSVLLYRPVFYLGLGAAPSPLTTQFAGLAPGLVGVDQVNVRLPWDVPQGCAVPLWISGSSVDTQLVMVSIRQGGGPCVEAPMARTGQLTWTRTTVTRPGEPAASERESFSAVFREGAENWLRATPNPEAGQWRSFGTKNPAPRCGLYAGANVDAGALTIRTPANDTLLVRPTRSGTGEFLYEQVLPAGSLQPGWLSVESPGSATVGPIDARVLLPPPLRIVTDLRPGTTIDPTRPFRLEWTGGRGGDVVNVRLLSSMPLGLTVGYEGYAPAEEGSLVLETREPPLGDGPRLLPLLPTDEFSVIVRVLPRSGTPFSAPGLTLGGQHEWVYEYHFLGLKLRQQAQ